MNKDQKKSNRPPDNGENKQPRTIFTLILIALVFTILINALYESISGSQFVPVTYDEFLTMVDENQVDSVEFQSDRILILTREPDHQFHRPHRRP